ncbi:MAG: zinc ribbon domain-containing protein [Liquorilactobacillus nagelii]|uniref:TcaA 3rd/4th domain-containing protein n=1 Tax=Liquorilactobacillus nagelii TaxID=82688 RepID=UPI0039E882C5
MQQNMYCPECGEKIQAGDEFCPNCGKKIEKVESNTNDSSQDPVNETVELQRSKEIPTSNKPKRSVVLLLLVAVVGLIALYFGLKSYYEPQRQLNRIVSTMGNPDKNLAKYIETNDPSLQKKISNSNLKPTQKYFANNRQGLAVLKSTLAKGKTYQDSYSLVRSGNYWLLFPRYKVKVKPVYVTISTNYSGVKIFKNGKKVFTTTKNMQSKKIGPLFPGTYTFKATGQATGKRLSTVKREVLNATSSEIGLNLQMATFTLYGKANSVVYLNNKKVGKLNEEGLLTFKKYPLPATLKGYVVDNSNNKKKKSQTVNIKKILANGYQDIFFKFKTNSKSSASASSASASSDNESDDTSDQSDQSSSVDTKNLTTQQVNDWIFVHLKKDYDFSVTEDDFIFDQQKNDAGILEITVYENSDSSEMQAHGADGDVSHRVGTYSIDSDGNLFDEDSNSVVSTHYGE